MNGPSGSLLDPIENRDAFLAMIRRTVLDIAPYDGVLGVLLFSSDADDDVTLTDDRCMLPAGLTSRLRSIDDNQAAEALLDNLVTIYRDILNCDGTIV